MKNSAFPTDGVLVHRLEERGPVLPEHPRRDAAGATGKDGVFVPRARVLIERKKNTYALNV